MNTATMDKPRLRTNPDLSFGVYGAGQEIAVIGMSGQFAGGSNLKRFWRNLCEKRTLITEIPPDHWDYRKWYDKNQGLPDKTYCKWGSFITDVDKFDAAFFNISPREAAWMDPQLRLLLQNIYTTAEDAGYINKIRGTDTGVFIGVCCHDYRDLINEMNLPVDPYVGIGNTQTAMANRISFTYDLKGPSIAIDTACSSALFAMHHACRSLRDGECRLAFVGGVNLLLSSWHYRYFSSLGALSPTGRCHTFDQRADGYIPGECVASLLLKPYDKARADNDRIYAVIKGSAALHGGYTPSITAPSVAGESNVILKAWENAGIDPVTLTYIETHGTGTKLGDPVEINSLKKAFGRHTRETNFCAVGSVKANIGHTEGAAGIASVIKTILQMMHRKIPPLPEFEMLNPYIKLDNSPLYLPREVTEWTVPQGQPRRAGVSSFGFTGAYAHVVLEESNSTKYSKTLFFSDRPMVFPLSAVNADRLRKKAEDLVAALKEEELTQADLIHIAYTLQTGREMFQHRVAVVADAIASLTRVLTAFIRGETTLPGLFRGKARDQAGPTRSPKGVSPLTVAEAWVGGGRFQWGDLYQDHRPRILSLPPYPFEKRRHWLPDPLPQPQATEVHVPDIPTSDSCKQIIMKKTWIPAQGDPPKKQPGSLAILSSSETKELAYALERHLYDLDIIDIHDLDCRLDNRMNGLPAYEGVIDLTGCSDSPPRSNAWLAWLQRAVEAGWKREIRLISVTRGLESFENKHPNLSGACQAGLFRMLGSEYPAIRSRHLDGDPGESEEVLAEQIARELRMDTRDAEVCYRNGIRYRACLAPVAPPSSPCKEIRIPGEHVLWMTGGTGGLGALCAVHFVKTYGVRKIVLSGREKLPDRGQWQTLMDQGAPEARKIRRILELEALGVAVRVSHVSLTDPDALAAELDDIKTHLGDIGGVVHCAGCVDRHNPAFIRKPLATIENIMAPKVAGLNNLCRLLKDEPLQLFVLFSSVSAIVPDLAKGQSDYAMANAYMDYMASAARLNCSVTSIQWPSWKEAGLGEAAGSVYKNAGFLSISNRQGLDFLDEILSCGMGPVVLPAAVDPALWQPERLMMQSETSSPPPSSDSAARKATSPAKAAPEREAAPEGQAVPDGTALRDHIVDWLTGLFAREMRIDPCEFKRDIPFTEYGLDSILISQILSKINQCVKQEIDPSILYEYQTLDTLTDWLADNYAGPLTTALNIPSPPVPETAESHRHKPGERIETPAAIRSKKRTPSPNTVIVPKSQSQTDIAVIGMSCRFPGANNIDEFWDLLTRGQTAFRPVSADHWQGEETLYAGLLDRDNRFDHDAFLIPESDARAMDPQALLLLEETAALISHAGYTRETIKGGSVGVYIGGRSQHLPDDQAFENSKNLIVAVGQNYLAANISHFFDLKGPSMVLDTACSSALVGLNMAISALRNREISSAIIGGVNLLDAGKAHKVFQKRNLLSKGPHFHMLDQRANGIILGEGAGMVMIKPLDQALKDQNTVYALIRGTAVNNDGRSPGPASPNIQAQKDVMQAALSRCGLSPEQIAYIEVNGSGSEVTDLLELKAIQSVYRSGNAAVCKLGSAKPNIGHTICAAGMVGLIKVVLMLNRGSWVPFLSGDRPMNHFDMAASPFEFCRTLTPLRSGNKSAAINCFADGGTNAHVILSAYDGQAPVEPSFLPVKETAGRSLDPEPDRFEVVHRISEAHELIKNHRAYGSKLLPGLAYIDLVFQAFVAKGYDFRQLELTDVSIYTPLTLDPSRAETTLTISCAKADQDQWSVRISGIKEGGADAVRYVSARMWKTQRSEYDERIDMDRIKASAKDRADIDTVYAQRRQRGLVHTGIMKATGTIYHLDTEVVMDLSLESDGTTATPELFHPTLIDASAVGAGVLFAALVEKEERLFIPVYYGSFRASEKIRTRCIARVKSSAIEREKDLLYMTVEFFNPAGKKIGELRNFVNKQIRQPENGTFFPELPAEPSAAERAPDEISDAHGGYEAAESLVCRTMAQFLNLDENGIDTDCGYYELGMDSPMLLEAVTVLEKKLATRLPPILLFEHDTVAGLARHLAETYPEKFRSPARPKAWQEARPGACLKLEKSVRTSAAPAPETRKKPLPRDPEIAIIGVSGRYPGAADVDEFWQALKTGRDCITPVPSDRWDARTFFDPAKNTPGKTYCNWGGFMDGIDRFDPLFFNISPREARVMDPYERLFLETVWTLVEGCGYTRSYLKRKYRSEIGVFVGAWNLQYQLVSSNLPDESGTAMSSLGSIANRVSHFFGFQGPSLAVDTMCSSSLVALHMAVEGIRKAECRLAVAGGVNLTISPKKYIGLSSANMLGSRETARSFSDSDGYLSSEGVGAVLLKSYEDAVQDGDRILGVIKSIAVSHNGHSSGYSVPNLKAQERLIAENIRKSGVDPLSIGYIESAANGSGLGDAIEVAALTDVFKKYTDKPASIPLGSVKSNIGHAEAASGMAALTKVLLQFQHKKLVPSIKATPLNPNIRLEDSPFYIPDKLQDWHPDANGAEKAVPRCAAISSIGAGGTNAHLIVQEHLPSQETALDRNKENGPQLIVLSAKKQRSLKRIVQQMSDYLAAAEDTSLADIAFTLQIGREAMPYRLAVVASDREELKRALAGYLCEDAPGQDGRRPHWHQGSPETSRSMGKQLFSGALGSKLAALLIEENDLDQLAQFWVHGGDIDWDALHDTGSARRILLPTYPFDRKSYWVPPPEHDTRKDMDGKDMIRNPMPAPAQSIPAGGRPDRAPPESPEAPAPSCQSGARSLKDVAIDLVRNVFKQSLEMEAADLDIHADITEFGVDSVHALMIIKELQQTLGEIPPYIFIEFPSIDSLSNYLAAEHADGLEAMMMDRPTDRDRPAGTDRPCRQAPSSLPDPSSLSEIQAADAAALLRNLDELGSEEVDHLLSLM